MHLLTLEYRLPRNKYPKGTQQTRFREQVVSHVAALQGLDSAGDALTRRKGKLTAGQVRRYLTLVKTTISSKGQIVLPAEFRQMDRIEPGQEFEIERLDRGDYRLTRHPAPQNRGAIDWLLACPYKGFFEPVESESTDTL